MKTSPLLLSVVLPIRNEEEILWDACNLFAQHFDRSVGKENWQYVLMENGSSDKTPGIIKEIVQKWPRSISESFAKGDRGHALREGILSAQGIWILIMDVDHLWDSPYFEWAWKHREEYDLVIASKRADSTLNKQGMYRRMLSAGLSAILNCMFDCVVAETRGMKFIHTEKLRPIAEVCQMRRGIFETEMTLRTLRGRLWVAELPVPYIYYRRPRNFMIKKIEQNVRDLFRLYRVMNNVPYEGHIKYRRFCREDLISETTLKS